MEANHIEGYDCIDDNLRIVLKDNQIDIRRIFNKLWYFRFNKNLDSIGKGLMCTNIFLKTFIIFIIKCVYF